MLVHQILKSKNDATVVTIGPDATLNDVVEMLASRRIGAVVVSDNGSAPLGILSERDIVREFGRRGADCLPLAVRDVMTSKLVTCVRDETAEEVLTKMTEGRFRHLPVIDGGKMIGLISIGDVVKARLSELAMERDALQDMVMGH
jgi:CBS domain-containing protein